MSEAIKQRIKDFDKEIADEIESQTRAIISELDGKVTDKHEIGTLVFSDDSSGVYDIYLTPEGIGYGQYHGEKFVPNISTDKLIRDVYRFGTRRFSLLPFLEALEGVRESYAAK